MKRHTKHITVLGDGGWGTTLAIYLSKKGYSVKLWGAFPGYVKELIHRRYNPKFLPGIKIPKEISITSNLATALEDAEVVVLAVPSQYAIGIIRKVKKYNFSNKILLSVVKGINNSTLLRISQEIYNELGRIQLAVLSGPTIASQVAQDIPSTAVIASHNMRTAKELQNIFNSQTFRVYTSSDVAGVELGGSIKNVIAIACGLCDGLGFGTNTKAAILSRGLVEMARLGKSLGAQVKTFSGLSGLGDLVTTCFSPKSRNRFVGEQLGKGKSTNSIISKMDMVAEGVTTVKSIYALSKKHNVSMPITAQVYNIIYRRKKPLVAVADLMKRKLKKE